jgi:hypothetical protein
VQRIADDQNQGRTLLLQELKGEIRLLTRTIGAAALRNAGGAS